MVIPNPKPFTVYPAIDLRRGEVVRLMQGDPERQTTYNPAPGAAAERWLAAGADWVHVVNLDGAFGEASPENVRALQTIVTTLHARQPRGRLQLGGGLRDLTAITQALTLGADRVILGTIAVQEPAVVRLALDRFGPEKIGVGIDVRDGRAAIRGWQEASAITAADLVHELAGMGLRTIVYTDINRDGMQGGADLENAAALAQESGLEVIAAGGVHALPELQRAKALGLAGAVIGRALYEGQIDLQAALRALV